MDEYRVYVLGPEGSAEDLADLQKICSAAGAKATGQSIALNSLGNVENVSGGTAICIWLTLSGLARCIHAWMSNRKRAGILKIFNYKEGIMIEVPAEPDAALKILEEFKRGGGVVQLSWAKRDRPPKRRKRRHP